MMTQDMEKQFSFIDLFAGIGGIRRAFEAVGGNCIFSSEWDSYAQKTYVSNYGDVPNGDITQVDVRCIPYHDILTAGFPCQPFSIAGVSKKNSLGRQHGFLDETQGTLFFDVARIIDAKRPRAFLLENVKNIKNHDKGRTFAVIQKALAELDYEVSFEVMDARHYVPQHRERIIIVGFDRRRYGDSLAQTSFRFPQPPENSSPRLKDILFEKVEDKYTLSDNLWNYLQNYAAKHKAQGNGFGFGLADLNGVARTLSARYYKDGSEILIPQEGKNPRRLTPRECARLMGFDEEFEIVVSDTRAYKQFGNSVVVPLVRAVAQVMVERLHSLENQQRPIVRETA